MPRHKSLFWVLIFFCMQLYAKDLSSKHLSGVSYYVNALKGDKTGDGSLKRPFSSLEAVNQVRLLPGDKLFLAGGQVFEGTLRIHACKGTKEAPLTIRSYGKGCATIHAKSNTALTVDSSSYVQIDHLIVKGDGRLSGNDGSGIDVKYSDHLTIDHVEASGFLWNGVCTYGGSDIQLMRIVAYENGFAGIHVTGPWSHKEVRNVSITDCVAENNPGNPRIKDNHSGSGILVSHATKVLIERCEAMNNGWDMPRPGNGPVGIWAYECDSLTIQYCYSHDNKTSAEGKDGGGFDFDGGITNSVMQYNLSMNNEGAGYGLFQFGGASQWNHNEVRYNVSIHDGKKNSQAGFFIWCDPFNKDIPLSGSNIHHNVIINRYGHSVSFETGYSSGLHFYENTFYLTDEGTEHIHGDYTRDGVTFKQNVFWSEKEENEGVAQSVVREDPEAKYMKQRFRIPDKVRIARIKEIVDSFLKEKTGE
ncbi:MAG: right-handed parallel beta-helix repeat-containing protein [Bacteroidales bacterium]|nr:right-handed parallel beta-helix repeat-containing protein [Bacteroidales bacterium]